METGSLATAVKPRIYQPPAALGIGGAAEFINQRVPCPQNSIGYGLSLPLSYISGRPGVAFSHTSSIERLRE